MHVSRVKNLLTNACNQFKSMLKSTRSRIKKMFSSILMKIWFGGLWKKKPPDQSAFNQQAALYHTCSECPLSVFIKCLVDSDIYALVISGTPTVEDISEAWANLFSEYLDLNNDNEAVYILNLQKDICILQNKIDIVEALLFSLTAVYDKRLVAILEDYDIFIDLETPQTEKEYLEAINIADIRLAPVRLNLETKNKELNEYKAGKDAQTIDAQYFQRMLVRLSKHQGYKIIAEQTTVAEFILLTEEFFEYYKKENKPLENVD